MKWETIKDIAAIWGAGLSTLLAAVQFLPSRPYVRIEPGRFAGKARDGYTTLTISNPSRATLLIGEPRRWQLRGKGGTIGIGDRFISMAIWGENPLNYTWAVPAMGSLSLDVVNLGFKESWLVCFRWRHDWLLPVWLPYFLIVSRDLQDRLNEAHKQWLESLKPPAELP